MANTNSTPTLRSLPYRVIVWPPQSCTPPNGITDSVATAAITQISGASRKIVALAPSGTKSSLKVSLPRSASGCMKPKGPARLGPRRAWNRPISWRSARVR
ncbi:MAG: hypothetical protein EBU23_17975 [Mycobacteriaceae bacterium]|nr:hypothetical protein [Mycobacteriaceae bacterium]